MMKKIIFRLLILVIGIVFILLIKGLVVKALNASAAASRIETLPAFSLPTITGDIFNSDDLQEGPVLIVYFHPECDHCRYEIASILERDLTLEGVTVLLVSYSDPESIKTFMKQFIFEGGSYQILTDESLLFSRTFGTNVIPSNFIYDEDLKLVKFFKGETDTELILRYIENGS